jgi:hypothetical protein
MRDEVASFGFLAVAITGFVLLCSGLLALTFGGMSAPRTHIAMPS